MQAARTSGRFISETVTMRRFRRARPLALSAMKSVLETVRLQLRARIYTAILSWVKWTTVRATPWDRRRFCPGLIDDLGAPIDFDPDRPSPPHGRRPRARASTATSWALRGHEADGVGRGLPLRRRLPLPLGFNAAAHGGGF